MLIQIKIKYKPGMLPIVQAHPGEWYDLRAEERIEYHAGDCLRIGLGVAMEMPAGFEAKIEPRSCTFSDYGLIWTSSGVIDNRYNGDADWWGSSWYAVRDGIIEKNDRICQFRVFRIQDEGEFTTVNFLNNCNRGGFGSTGKE